MFRNAYKIASGFTAPVIISRKAISGECASAIGAFVVINKDGWIVTAAHILDQLETLKTQTTKAAEVALAKQSIQSDHSLSEKEKRKKIGKLDYPPQNSTDQCSIWWGVGGESQLVYAASLGAADLAVGRLEPFDSKWIPNYPIFKDPSKNFDYGTSLLKVGFPFHSITPSWDNDKKAFLLPEGALPVPRFPIEGIFTRHVDYLNKDGTPLKFPIRFVESSTPGLRGQSGGPTVDTKGTVWAIQSKTAHLPLGFSPQVPQNPGHTEHQFLNVGLGIHPATLFAFFNEQGIQFQISEY